LGGIAVAAGERHSAREPAQRECGLDEPRRVSVESFRWEGWSFTARPSKYPRELQERAVRLVTESKNEYPSEFDAIRSVAVKLGIGSSESLRKWVRRAEIDGGTRPGKTSEEIAEIRALKKENAELRRANEILKSASAFFASMPS
jgi:transposase